MSFRFVSVYDRCSATPRRRSGRAGAEVPLARRRRPLRAHVPGPRLRPGPGAAGGAVSRAGWL